MNNLENLFKKRQEDYYLYLDIDSLFAICWGPEFRLKTEYWHLWIWIYFRLLTLALHNPL